MNKPTGRETECHLSPRSPSQDGDTSQRYPHLHKPSLLRLWEECESLSGSSLSVIHLLKVIGEVWNVRKVEIWLVWYHSVAPELSVNE